MPSAAGTMSVLAPMTFCCKFCGAKMSFPSVGKSSYAVQVHDRGCHLKYLDSPYGWWKNLSNASQLSDIDKATARNPLQVSEELL